MTDNGADPKQARGRTASYILLGALLFVGFFLLREVAWEGNKQLHTLMELLATFLAFMVGVLALVRFYTKKNNTFLFIGAAFIGTALLDGYHTIVTSTFFDTFFPSPSPSLIPWSWNASRTYLSIVMFLSWAAWRREMVLGEKGRFSEYAVYSVMGLLTIASFFFFAFVPLPRAYYPELLFGRPEEFVSATFFLMALIGYLRKGAWKTDALEHWVVLSLIVGFMGQAMFMSSSFRLFDTMFDLAHLLKKVSYVAVLNGLLISIYLTYKMVYRQQGELLKEVTDRQQAEALARSTSSRLSSLIENLHAGILVEDQSRHIAVINQTFCDLFGIPVEPAVLLGTDCSNAAEESKHLFVEPQAFVKRIDEILRKREIVTDELLYLVDGRIFERDYIPIFGGNKYEGHAWQYRNITERQQAEEALKESEEQLQLALMGADLGLWDWNIQTGEVRFNERWTEMLGYTLDELEPHYDTWAKLVHPDDMPRVLQLLNAHLEGKTPYYETELRLQTKSGDWKWILEKGKVFTLDKAGKPVRAVGTHLDITERHQAEEALQESEARILAIVDSVANGIIVINEEGIVENFNRGAEQIFGYTAEEVIGHNVNMLMPQPYHHEHDGYLNNFLKTGQKKIIGIGREVSGLRKDGSSFPMHLSVTEVALTNRTLFTGIVRDITESKQAKEALHQARDAAEDANRAKSEFLAKMSHELRTPLNSVIGFANVLAKNKGGHLGEQELVFIERITDNGRHLLDLINDILDLSKVEAGKLELLLSDVALDQLLNDTVAQLGGEVRGKKVKLATEIPKKIKSLQTDEAKLKQVLINLLGNALKFTEKGSITISVITDPETHRPERIEVRDTGIGIPADRLANIFEAFQQAETGTARQYGGTGLGLAISRSLCDLMGYQLNVSSTVGVGTTFSIILASSRDG
ncbi:MAG: PAS domain S-box protein [Candidatus Marinimicrobia bacterium]|nr:PAS domain S-box protein [Candidatus Neomarinimicrobiota bacterium]